MQTSTCPPKQTTRFRPGTVDDCYSMAQLFAIASDGVTNYVWHTLRDQYPGLSPLEIGAARYADPANMFGYSNCTIAEQSGRIAGMMVTFPIHPAETTSSDPAPTPPAASAEPDVLAPYNLEAPNTWYICALAVFPEFRGQGIGSQLLQVAHQQAARNGFAELSLLCFEQNVGALQLYQRNGFKEIDRVAVVPHPLIHHRGDLLLMTTPVQQYPL
ncbi:MAG TPA: GNAT family N-acetyltransferase [Trichocoleus sp.]